jgi:serine/threonine-protein kinase HipA
VLGDQEITGARLGTVQGEEGIALIVERFDRLGNVRLRLEDFAQVLQRPRGREFDGKYNSSYEEAASVVGRFSSRAQIDLGRFFRLVVFNLVIGNADAHLKNFSLLERGEGLRLSPAYDLLNTIVYPQYERHTALAIDGAKRPFESLDRDLVVGFGVSIGLPHRVVDTALSQLAKGFAGARTLDFPANVQPDDFRTQFRDIVVANAERILG